MGASPLTATEHRCPPPGMTAPIPSARGDTQRKRLPPSSRTTRGSTDGDSPLKTTGRSPRITGQIGYEEGCKSFHGKRAAEDGEETLKTGRGQ